MIGRSQPTLSRVVSRWEVVALSINDVVGSGVYLLPASAAMLLGPASVWAVPVAGVCVLFVVLCFAEAASLFDRPGGAYVYTRAAFGEFIGFEVGWMTWIARITSEASIAAGFRQALTGVWPAASDGLAGAAGDRAAARRAHGHQHRRRQVRCENRRHPCRRQAAAAGMADTGRAAGGAVESPAAGGNARHAGSRLCGAAAAVRLRRFRKHQRAGR